MRVHERGHRERDCGDTARIAANQAEFQEVIGDEIAWFERREASHLQARAELRAPIVESELVSRELELGKVMLYQEYLERAFERKWKLLTNYRMTRTEDSGKDKTIEVESRREGAPGESAAAGSNGEIQA